MKVENIVRTLACSPHEFIEIYQEGKTIVDPAVTPIEHQEWSEGGIERIIKFVSAAYAPEQLLKILGSNKQLKEQQELTIAEGGIKIHTFYLPDMVPDSFRVETFWNITKDQSSSEEKDESTSIIDISIHSESGSYSMGKMLESFVAKSIAATITQYLDVVDSYFSKWRTKMKQLLDPRNFLSFRFGGSGRDIDESGEKLDSIESEEELAERMQDIIVELKRIKNQLFRESQRILKMEIEFAEKRDRSANFLAHSSTPTDKRTLTQLAPTTESQSTSSASLSSSNLPTPVGPVLSNFDERILQSCENNLRNLRAQSRHVDAQIDHAMAELGRRVGKHGSGLDGGGKEGKEGQKSTFAQVCQCAKYVLPLSLLVLAVLHRRKVL